MTFDHERLDVYRLSLDFLKLANDVVVALPRGRAYFADELGRAALSIVLNVAEGAGKTSANDKRRYYVTARGSATESAALLDALHRVALLETTKQEAGKEMLLRIVSMLVKLARNLESAAPSRPMAKETGPEQTEG